MTYRALTINRFFGNHRSLILISIVKLFADDVKIYVVVDNDTKVAVLQEGLNKLQTWSERWQLNLSSHKCPVLHIGDKNNNTVHSAFMHVSGIGHELAYNRSVLIGGALLSPSAARC